MGAAKLVPVTEWAQIMFGERRFHANTLRNWVNTGKIQPQPIKLGREYFCSPDARYVDPVAERISRMAHGR